MKTGFRSAIRLALTSAIFFGAGTFARAQTGVIVEQVSKDLEAERAGVQKGDVLAGWVCGSGKGDIKSPFDLLAAEIEQAPHCAVTIEGYRGEEKRAWTLGPGRWGAETRPDLPEALLSAYRECQALGKTSATVLAPDQCRPDAVTEGPFWLRSWFALQAAEALVRARQWQLSDKAFELAVQFGRQAGSAIAAQVFNKWATACESRGDLENADHRYQESLLQYQKENSESLAIAMDLNGLGSVARKRGELANAEDNSRRALAMEEKLAPDSLDVALSLNNLGNIALARRDFGAATNYHQQALEIRKRLAPGSEVVAVSLNNLSVIAAQQDELDRSEDYQLQALAIRKILSPESMEIAASFNNLGNIAWTRGDLVKAERYYREGFQIRQKLAPNSSDLADILSNLSMVAQRRGELIEAEQYCRQALLIEQKHGIQTLETANILHNLANVLWERGDRAAAHEYDLQALQIREKLAPGSLDVAAGLTNLGLSAQERGNLTEAETYDRRALEIEKQLAPESLIAGLTLRQLGDIAQAHKDFAAAESFYRQSLVIQEKLVSGSANHVKTAVSLARVLSRTGRLDAARSFFEQALQALEAQTAKLGGTETVRSEFRARYADYFADYIHLLFLQKQQTLAFEVAERTRARSLLEVLNASGSDVSINKGVDPGLLSEKQRLEQVISNKTSHRIDLLNGKHTRDQVDAIDQEMAQLLGQYQQVGDQIRAASPAYDDLTRPQPLKASQVQQQLLDADTLLLEYSLGQTYSYVWVITQNSLTAYELPARNSIEAAARRVYKLLMSPGRESETELKSWETSQRLATTALSRMVLEPAARHLNKKRLVIVADGALQYVPFEALALRHPKNQVPLIVDHEIVYLPSASVLAVLRHADKMKQASSKAVAVLADPVFDKDDIRVRTVQARRKRAAVVTDIAQEDAQLPGEHFTRSSRDVGLKSLPRLPFSRREADAILAATPRGQGKEFLDFQASRATASDPALADYHIIHFATHGLLDSKRPELSGLVLSMVDEAGNFQNGFLDLEKIYNLSLRADLVVLSACETALGKEIRGEGLIGLTRGFMYGGASRVLASLWKVDDVATAELMRAFYKLMEVRGMPPAAALRQAQIQIRKQTRWSQPYYWAGFQLQGDWR